MSPVKYSFILDKQKCTLLLLLFILFIAVCVFQSISFLDRDDHEVSVSVFWGKTVTSDVFFASTWSFGTAS